MNYRVYSSIICIIDLDKKGSNFIKVNILVIILNFYNNFDKLIFKCLFGV